jgi:hypothetical protein
LLRKSATNERRLPILTDLPECVVDRATRNDAAVGSTLVNSKPRFVVRRVAGGRIHHEGFINEKLRQTGSSTIHPNR